MPRVCASRLHLSLAAGYAGPLFTSRTAFGPAGRRRSLEVQARRADAGRSLLVKRVDDHPGAFHFPVDVRATRLPGQSDQRDRCSLENVIPHSDK